MTPRASAPRSSFRPHLPLRASFPAHTVSPFDGTTHSELSAACVNLVEAYFRKVGLPSKPSIPKRGALPGFGVIRGLGRAPKMARGEARVALLGVAPGDRLFFEFAYFAANRKVATEATLQQYTIGGAKNENAPPPTAWIPAAAAKAMESWRHSARVMRILVGTLLVAALEGCEPCVPLPDPPHTTVTLVPDAGLSECTNNSCPEGTLCAVYRLSEGERRLCVAPERICEVFDCASDAGCVIFTSSPPIVTCAWVDASPRGASKVPWCPPP